jgi:prepilin-type N-terminal cleavage/methylation domain-containing protein
MRKLREKIYNDAAFTLIELLVVIAVLGILAGIAVPRITGVQENAKKQVLESNAQIVYNAMEMYNASEGSYPADMTNITGVGIDINLPSEITFKNSDADASDGSVTIQGNGYEVTITSSGGVGTISEQGS